MTQVDDPSNPKIKNLAFLKRLVSSISWLVQPYGKESCKGQAQPYIRCQSSWSRVDMSVHPIQSSPYRAAHEQRLIGLKVKVVENDLIGER